MDEAARFAPTLKAARFGPGDRQQMLDRAGPFDLIVCSYGLLQTESERLAAVSWTSVVADEAQAFKNVQTKRSKAVMALQADFRMIATGTPMEVRTKKEAIMAIASHSFSDMVDQGCCGGISPTTGRAPGRPGARDGASGRARS